MEILNKELLKRGSLEGHVLKARVDALMTSGSQRVTHTCMLLPASADYTP